jgi:hypothetical protein
MTIHDTGLLPLDGDRTGDEKQTTHVSGKGVWQNVRSNGYQGDEKNSTDESSLICVLPQDDLSDKHDMQGHVTTEERSGSDFDDRNSPTTPITIIR